jgi:CSLREA domain-containing protein
VDASDPIARAALTAQGQASVTLEMRLNPDAILDLVVLERGSDPYALLSAPQASITVDSALDSAVSGDGACTLREAILNANSDSDTTGGDCAAGAGTDEIGFAVGGGGSTATASPVPRHPASTSTASLRCSLMG